MPGLLRRWITIGAVVLCTVLLLRHLTAVGVLSIHPAARVTQESAIQPEELYAATAPSEDDSSTSHAFDWAKIPPRNPVTSMIPLPTGTPAEIPRIQFDFNTQKESSTHKTERLRRLAAVKEAFDHSWSGYRQNAWLHDEVRPLSGGPYDPFGGWGATLVDSLDTLWIMGMEKDFAVAVAALEKIDFSRGTQKDINLFETTIRYLGGFLAAYDLSRGKYPLLLKKAVEVAEMMYRAFDTPNRMPITRWDWQAYLNGKRQSTPQLELVAELGSLSLEFTRLTQLTKDPKYFDAVQRISNLFYAEQNQTKLPGLWPLTVNPSTGNFHKDSTFTIGGMADSVFEYLPKEYLLLQGRDQTYAEMHVAAINAAKQYLAFEPLVPPPSADDNPAYTITFQTPLVLGMNRVRTTNHMDLDPRGEHLTCFAGGMVALAARALSTMRTDAETEEDMSVALRLTQGCVFSYSATPTGIGPEVFALHPCRLGRDAVSLGAEPDFLGAHGDCTWSRDKWIQSVKGKPRTDVDGAWDKYVQQHGFGKGFTDVPDARYMLRPEAIESLFILWRITGDERMREAAWAMFESIVAYTRTDIAFAALPNVMWKPFESGESGESVAHDAAASTGTAKKEEITKFDGMESFWTAETLKYFYLIFADDDLVSLDEYVFNTEAHPLRWRSEFKG